MQDPAAFLEAFSAWAAQRPDVRALALVGSWARGTARPDSDVDLVLIVRDPAAYLHDAGWLAAFGALEQASPEDWGLVQAWRVRYRNGLEAEVGITSAAWAAVDPPDPGTARVVHDGLRVLDDREGLLAVLVAALQQPG